MEDIFIHPNYNKMQRTHDIALVRLSRNVDFTPYVRPACIDYSGVIVENRAIATGFGLIGHGWYFTQHDTITEMGKLSIFCIT